jgi:hypothetical protein
MSLKHLTILLVGIGLFAFCSAAQAYPYKGDNSDPKTYAILVGSRAPSNGVIDAIRGDLDVDNFASRLTWASDVKVLKYNWEDTSSVTSDIQSAASSIASEIKPGDSFIFYYSGHGTGGSGLGIQDYINPMSSSSCQDNSLADIFSDNSPFKDINKFFMIDSCHSEGIWKNDIDGDLDLQSLSKISFLASSSEDGDAYSLSDPALKGTSVFTNAILPSLTPDASFGNLLASAMTASSQVTGYLKGDGPIKGSWKPVGYTSGDFDLNTTLNGSVVPEPATLILILTGATSILIWRRRQ